MKLRKYTEKDGTSLLALLQEAETGNIIDIANIGPAITLHPSEQGVFVVCHENEVHFVGDDGVPKQLQLPPKTDRQARHFRACSFGLFLDQKTKGQELYDHQMYLIKPNGEWRSMGSFSGDYTAGNKDGLLLIHSRGPDKGRVWVKILANHSGNSTTLGEFQPSLLYGLDKNLENHCHYYGICTWKERGAPINSYYDVSIVNSSGEIAEFTDLHGCDFEAGPKDDDFDTVFILKHDFDNTNAQKIVQLMKNGEERFITPYYKDSGSYIVGPHGLYTHQNGVLSLVVVK